MPKIFKNFSLLNAALFEFPDAEQMLPCEQVQEVEEVENDHQPPCAQHDDVQEPLDFSSAQANAIVRDARKQAEEIVKNAAERAREYAEEIAVIAREDGYRAGYARGMEQAQEQGQIQRDELAARLQEQVDEFLQHAQQRIEQQLDENVGELRDLAIAIAEKVVCVSLKSSAEVIARMVQAAVDKRRRKEWANIYLAECDAKRMVQISPSLRASLSALSERVRIIPMAQDEQGTCIIEMPDQIIDASVSTQLENIRDILADASSAKGIDLF